MQQMGKGRNVASDSSTEKIINNRKRVRNHGEVFTPSHIVKRMLSLKSIKEACESLTATFLEPGAGEGAFLVEVLKRKLRMVERCFGDSLERYENYSLLALSTLYGIELLEDNTKVCVMKLSRAFYDAYLSKTFPNHGQMRSSTRSIDLHRKKSALSRVLYDQ
jgi:hypothetical protein